MNKTTKAILLLLLLSAIPIIFISRADAFQHIDPDSQLTLEEERIIQDDKEKEVAGHVDEGHADDVHVDDAHADGGHSSNMFPLLFIIIALIIGAGTRHWLRKSPLPFTVSLLIIGLGLGVAHRLGWFGLWYAGAMNMNMSFMRQSLDWAGG